MQSKATTVAQYLASLPPDRRAALAAVRAVILKNLDPLYVEGMDGMMGYCVPHSVYPAGYHCDPSKPLPFAGLASQKQYMALYLMCEYYSTDQEQWFRKAWARSGKKLDMGKCCVRFKSLDDVPLDVIGEAIKRVPVRKFIAYYEAALRQSGQRMVKGQPGAKAGKGPRATTKAKATATGKSSRRARA